MASTKDCRCSLLISRQLEVLILYSEYLPEQLVKRVNDVVMSYNFILNRLELNPMEVDDPANMLNDSNIEIFIDELKKIL